MNTILPFCSPAISLSWASKEFKLESFVTFSLLPAQRGAAGQQVHVHVYSQVTRTTASDPQQIKSPWFALFGLHSLLDAILRLLQSLFWRVDNFPLCIRETCLEFFFFWNLGEKQFGPLNISDFTVQDASHCCSWEYNLCCWWQALSHYIKECMMILCKSRIFL